MSARELQLCTFVVGNLLLGLPVDDVCEVVRGEQLTPVPLAAEAVVGLLNLRGRIVPAVDLRARFGLPSREPGVEGAHLVVQVLGEQISLLVDDTSDVVTVSAADREEVPETVADEIATLLTASYQRPDGLLLVLDAARAATEPMTPAPTLPRSST